MNRLTLDSNNLALFLIIAVAIFVSFLLTASRIIVFAGEGDSVTTTNLIRFDLVSETLSGETKVDTNSDTQVGKPSSVDENFSVLLVDKSKQLDSFYNTLKANVNEEKSLSKEISNLVAYLKSQGSPVATENYARQIITTSRENGGDYKIVIAIMGVESGFCRANYLVYNCFGYLNGVRYQNYNAAFADLIPKIVAQYVIPFGTNFNAFADAYGIVNVDYHAERLARYYNSI